MAEHKLVQILRGLRRRLLWIESAAGMGWGLASAVVLLIAAAWIDLVLELSPALRMASLAACAAAAGVMAALVVIRATRNAAVCQLARRLDDVAGTGGQIRSGVDLTESSAAAPKSETEALTVGLAQLAVARAAGLAGDVPKAAAVPAMPLRRAWLSLAALCGVTVLLGFLLPRVAATEWRRFTDPFGDHPPFSRIHFQVEPEGAELIYGSGLDIHVTVDGAPVESVELVLEPVSIAEQTADSEPVGVEVLPMFPEPGGRFRAAIANVTRETIYFVRSGKARSEKYRIRVITVPKFEEVRFRITPPEYTRRPSYEGPLPQGGLAGLPGARVEVWARSNRPLSTGHAAYVLDSGTRPFELNPLSEGSREVSGGFLIREAGRLDVRLVDSAGQESTETFSAPVTLLADERPFVRLVEPPATSFATPSAVVPVVISAEDDYGISRLQLFRSLNESRHLPLDIPVATPPPAHCFEVVPLPLAAYGLDPGDEIKLFARVEDNDPGLPPGDGAGEGTAGAAVPAASPVAGKGSESSIAVIRIISEEAFQQMQRTRDGLEMLMSKYQQARRRMESLADEVETLRKKQDGQPGDEKLNEQRQEELQNLINRMQKESEMLRKLGENELPYELDKQLTKELEKLANQVERLTKQADALKNKSDATNLDLEQLLNELKRQLDGEREQLDQEAMQPLEALARVMPLAKDESRFVQIYLKQRELAERLASLKGRDNRDDPALKARMRELEDEQRQNREALARLLDEIEEHVSRLPENEQYEELIKSALDFVESVRSSGATEAMVEAETGLAEFSGTRAHAGAKEAADVLEKFLSKCEGMGGAAGACLRFQPGMGDALGQTLAQLLADAGMSLKPGYGSGGGFGQGGGDGFSTRRSTLDNVGLYGGLPTFDQASASQAGTSSQQREGAIGSRSHRDRGDAEPDSYETSGSLSASGAGEASVPLRYRTKVGRYFQRIADELGGLEQ